MLKTSSILQRAEQGHRQYGHWAKLNMDHSPDILGRNLSRLSNADSVNLSIRVWLIKSSKRWNRCPAQGIKAHRSVNLLMTILLLSKT